MKIVHPWEVGMAPSKAPENSDLWASPACPVVPSDLALWTHFRATETEAQRDEVTSVNSTSIHGEPRARGQARDLFPTPGASRLAGEVGTSWPHAESQPRQVSRGGKDRPWGPWTSRRSEEAMPGLISGGGEGFNQKWGGMVHQAVGTAQAKAQREKELRKEAQSSSACDLSIKAACPCLCPLPPSPSPSSAWRSPSSGAKCTRGLPPAHTGSHPGCKDRTG